MVYNHSYYNSNKNAVLEKHKQTPGQMKEAKRKWYVQNSCKIVRAYRNKYLSSSELKKKQTGKNTPPRLNVKESLRGRNAPPSLSLKRKLEREKYASQPELKRKLKREKYASQP